MLTTLTLLLLPLHALSDCFNTCDADPTVEISDDQNNRILSCASLSQKCVNIRESANCEYTTHWYRMGECQDNEIRLEKDRVNGRFRPRSWTGTTNVQLELAKREEWDSGVWACQIKATDKRTRFTNVSPIQVFHIAPSSTSTFSTGRQAAFNAVQNNQQNSQQNTCLGDNGLAQPCASGLCYSQQPTDKSGSNTPSHRGCINPSSVAFTVDVSKRDMCAVTSVARGATGASENQVTCVCTTPNCNSRLVDIFNQNWQTGRTFSAKNKNICDELSFLRLKSAGVYRASTTTIHHILFSRPIIFLISSLWLLV